MAATMDVINSFKIPKALIPDASHSESWNSTTWLNSIDVVTEVSVENRLEISSQILFRVMAHSRAGRLMYCG